MLEQGFVWRGLAVSNLQRVRVGARLRMARFNCFKSSESTCWSEVTYGEVQLFQIFREYVLEQGYVWRGLTVSNLQRVRVGARLRMARFNCFKSSESTCWSKVTYGEV